MSVGSFSKDNIQPPQQIASNPKKLIHKISPSFPIQTPSKGKGEYGRSGYPGLAVKFEMENQVGELVSSLMRALSSLKSRSSV